MNNGTYTNPQAPALTYVSPALGSTGFSITNMFSQTSTVSWIIIILILAILGFNIFFYLAKGTQTFADIFGPTIQYFTGLFASITALVTKQIVNVAATGTKAGVDIAAGTVTGGIDTVGAASTQISGANSSNTTVTNQTVAGSSPPTDTLQNNALNNALNNATTATATTPAIQDPTSYQADEASSSIQASKSSGKSGWCYIGEDRGFRSCIQVGENDRCMSGDIFPDHNICVNPNLRK